MWPRPWRAMRAATVISWRRMVAPRALAWNGAGQRAGGAGQVVADGGQGQPGGIGREVPRRQVRERPGAQVCEDLLDDGVVAVLRFGLDHLERRVGEQGVVAPDGKQLVLAAGCVRFRSRTRRMISRAVIALPFFDANAV